MSQPTALDDYLFDLRGYLILEQSLEPSLVDALSTTLDAVPALPPSGWWGNVHRADNNPDQAGMELQNVVEAGQPFERLIDHPSWLAHVHRYCGEQDTYVAGLFIDECFASLRRTGGFFPVHSGGHRKAMRGRYQFRDGVFRCGQVNILMALTDIGLPHPQFEEFKNWDTGMDAMAGVVEVRLNKGDALLFCDGLAHGAASRTNLGERRVVIYRYGPSWATTRHGYQYSDELLARLTPQRRAILQPIPPRRPPAS